MDTPVKDLLKDFELYVPNFGHHSGNLKQHSLWVSYYIQDAIMFPRASPLGELWKTLQMYCNSEIHYGSSQLAINCEKVLIVSGLLHDIGKGGDHVFTYSSKPNHEDTGYLYLTNKLEYIFKDNTVLDISMLIKSLELNNLEAKLVNSLVRGHWDLGNLVIEYDYINALKTGRRVKTISKVIAKEFCIQNAKMFTKNTFKICILMKFMLCCADVLGAQPYCGLVESLTDFPLDKYPEFTKDCFKTQFSVYRKYYYSKIIKNVFPEICKILGIKK